jgi:type I restriction enzyme S subunit
MAVEDWTESLLGEMLALEYGTGLPEALRTGHDYPVIGSSGIVGEHSDYLVQGPGIVVGRKGTVGAIVWSDESFWPNSVASLRF